MKQIPKHWLYWVIKQKKEQVLSLHTNFLNSGQWASTALNWLMGVLNRGLYGQVHQLKLLK